MTFKGLFQPKLFHNSVIVWKGNTASSEAPSLLKHCRLSHCSREQGMPPTSNSEYELSNLAGKACLPSQCLLLLRCLSVSSQPKMGQSSLRGSYCFGSLAEQLCPIRPNIHTRHSNGRASAVAQSLGRGCAPDADSQVVCVREPHPGAYSCGDAAFCSLPVTTAKQNHKAWDVAQNYRVCKAKPEGWEFQ